MKEWTVTPLVGVGNVKFGMRRTEVRSILGDYSEFKKSKYSKNTTDNFNGCHVYYNQSDECEAIEIFDGISINFDGQVVFPLGFKEICEVLKKYDDYLEIEEGSCTSTKISIGVYAPHGTVEAILFGCDGYYL